MLRLINHALVAICLILALITILAVTDNLSLPAAQAQQNPTATTAAGGDAASAALVPTVAALSADIAVLKREQQQTATETTRVAAETAKVAAGTAKIAVAAANNVAETTRVHQEIAKINPLLTAQNDILTAQNTLLTAQNGIMAQMYERMTKEDNRIIRAIRYGTAKGEPDLAIITINVETQAPSASQGLTLANAQARRLRAAIQGLGVPADQIDIAGPVVAQTFDERQRVTGFKVTIPVLARVRDPARATATIEAISKLAGPQFKTLELKVSDPTAVKIKAREAALQDVRAKAELYARAAGGTLGQVLEISEDFIPIEPKTIDPNKPQVPEEKIEVMIVFELK